MCRKETNEQTKKKKLYTETLGRNEVAETLLSNGKGSGQGLQADQSTREIAGKRNLSEHWRRLKFVPGSDYGITGLRYSGGGQRGSGSGKD